MTLDEAIKHAEDVAFYKEDFANLQKDCNFCWFGRDIMGWIETCRHPDNVPKGSSWGDCTKEKCPYYQECIECEKEHRQLAEWLRELKAYKEDRHSCESCEYEYNSEHQLPCSECSHNFRDRWEWRGESE